MLFKSVFSSLVIFVILLHIKPNSASSNDTVSTTESDVNLTKNQDQDPQSVDNRFFGLGNLFGQLFPGGPTNGNRPQFGQNNNQNNFSPGLNQAPNGQNNFGRNPNFQRPDQGSFPNQGQFNQNPGQWTTPGQLQGGSPNQGQFNQNPGQWTSPDNIQGGTPNQGQWNPGQNQNGQNPGQWRPNGVQWPNQDQNFNQNPSSPGQWQNPNQGISNPNQNQNMNFPGQWENQGQNINQRPPINQGPGSNQNQGSINPDQWQRRPQNQNQGNFMNPNQWQNQNQGSNLRPDQWQNQQNQNNPSLWQNQGINPGQIPNQNQIVSGQLANPGQNQNNGNPQWQNQGLNQDQLNFPNSGQWENQDNTNQANAQNPTQGQNQGNQNQGPGAQVNPTDNIPGQSTPDAGIQFPSDGQSTGAGNTAQNGSPGGIGSSNSGTGAQTGNTINTTPNLEQCMLNCPVTNEYSPICGSNNKTYANPATFQCARRCGVNLEISRRGRCPNDSPFRHGL